MSRAAEQVAEFHRFFGQPVRDKLTRLTDEEVSFRTELISEEYEELLDEFFLNVDSKTPYDAQKVYKELADLVYVIYGLDAFMGGYLDRTVAAVHESNMTKLWECGCQSLGPDEELGITGDFCPTCGPGRPGWYVKCREDGKVLKPSTYTPANLDFITEDE